MRLLIRAQELADQREERHLREDAQEPPEDPAPERVDRPVVVRTADDRVPRDPRGRENALHIVPSSPEPRTRSRITRIAHAPTAKPHAPSSPIIPRRNASECTGPVRSAARSRSALQERNTTALTGRSQAGSTETGTRMPPRT